MRIFVTGANGFIGRAFCAEARKRGHHLLGLCRAPAGDLACEIATGSMQDVPWRAIEDFRPEAVLHLAWIATPGAYLNSPDNDLLLTQSQQLFRGLAERGVKHVAGAGTCIEYAASSSPLREDASPLSPTYPYSRAKASLLQWLNESGPALNVRSSWFRIFYPYGPGEHPNRLPSIIIRKLAARETMELRTPDSIKDYIYVDDLAKALCASLEAGLTGAINIGSGHGVMISQMARLIAEALGADPRLITRAEVPAADPWPVQIADVTKLQAAGWQPETALNSGMARLSQALLHAG